MVGILVVGQRFDLSLISVSLLTSPSHDFLGNPHAELFVGYPNSAELTNQYFDTVTMEEV